MVNFFKEINKKINGVILSLLCTGIVLLLLAVLIVWTDFMIRLVIGLLVLVISYAFLYGSWKIWTLKKEIEKYFKL